MSGRFEKKMAASSFGTRQASAARHSVSQADASRVVGRAEQISRRSSGSATQNRSDAI